MKIIKSGSKHNVHGNDLIVLDKLAPATYKVGFNDMQGFFLVETTDLKVAEEKIYGENEHKVNKTLHAFAHSTRSVGAMFTGKKGYGKSLSLQLLAKKSIEEYNLPVIIVTINVPGLSNFIQSIEQEVVIIFDEFEKIFSIDGGGENQERMLSLFDGLAVSKHLYIISANELNRISEYLLNRPGRFHYHFQFAEPSPEEVFEYMSDKLKPEYQAAAKSVMELAKRTKFNFDTLRAIAFELNLGYTLSSAIKDLNISLNDAVEYELEAEFSDGTKLHKNMDIRLSTTLKDVSFVSNTDKNLVFNAEFDLSKAKYENEEFFIELADVNVKFMHTRNDDDCEEDFVEPTPPTLLSISMKRRLTFSSRDTLSDAVAAF